MSVWRFLLGAVLILSTWIQFSVVTRTEINKPLRADALAYFSSAYNVRNFGVYSSARTWQSATPVAPVADSFVSPGYPAFLLAVGNPKPTLEYVRKVTFVQGCLGVFSVLLIFLISRRFIGDSWAVAAALITALSPHLAVMATYLLTESLFIFLLFLSIYGTQVAVESGRTNRFVLAGALWALCSLVRPTAMFIPLVLYASALLVPRLRAYGRPALLGVLCFCVVLAPWHLRNLTISGHAAQPSLMVNFLNFGSYPNFMYEDRPETYGFPYASDPDATRHQRDLPSVLASIATKFKEDPARYARWYLLGKPGFFLSWTNIDGVADVFVYPVVHSPYFEDRIFSLIRTLMFVLHWPLMLMGVAGLLVAWLRPDLALLAPPMRMAAGLVAVIFAYSLAFHMVGAPLPRYGIPFRPLLYPMALLLLRTFWLRRSQSNPALSLDSTQTNLS